MQNYFEIHAFNYKLCSGQAQYVFDHFDLFLTPVTLTFNLLKKNVSNGTSPQGQQLCQIVLKSLNY